MRYIDSLQPLSRSILKKLPNFSVPSNINIVQDTHSLRCAFVTILFFRRIFLVTKAVNAEETKRNWSFPQDSNVLKTPSLQENHNQCKNKETNKLLNNILQNKILVLKFLFQLLECPSEIQFQKKKQFSAQTGLTFIQIFHNINQIFCKENHFNH